MKRESVFTLPNLVSTSRFALALGFVAVDAAPVRLALIGIASATDVLDGWLARRSKLVSQFGALLDPIADRFFVLGVVVAYVAGGQLTPLQAGLVMLRDVMSVIGFITARLVSWLRDIPFRARFIGKVVTVAQLFTFFVVLVAPSWVSSCVWIVALLGAAASVDYTLMLWRESRR